MQTEDLEAGHTAVAFTDLFVDAGVAKLDALFGAGYAMSNPGLLGAYVTASATNLNSFMMAATQVAEDDFDDEAAIQALQAVFSEPRTPSKGKRGR